MHRTTVHQTGQKTGQKTGQSSFQQAVFYSEIPLKTVGTATLVPGHWTEELASDFTAGLDIVARRMALHVWRAGARGIHRSALCQRTELTPAELRSLLMRMGHALRTFQRERGMALSRPVAANSPLQTYFVDPDFGAVAGPRYSARGRRTSCPVA